MVIKAINLDRPRILGHFPLRFQPRGTYNRYIVDHVDNHLLQLFQYYI